MSTARDLALKRIKSICVRHSLCVEDLIACHPEAGTQNGGLLSRAHDMWVTDELRLIDINVTSEADDADWLLAWVRVPKANEEVQDGSAD